MLRLQKLSIRHKLITIILMTSTLFILMTALLSVGYEYFSFRRDLVNKTQTLAQVVGINSTAALAFEDPDTGEEILSALGVEPYVLAARILTPNGQTFAAYSNPNAPAAANSVGSELQIGTRRATHFKTHFFELSQPIMLSDRLLGHVVIRADLKPLHNRLKWFAASVTISMLVFLGIAYLLSARLQRIISTPVANLVATIDRVATDRDYNVRASKTTEDELGTLIDGFNDMLSQIQTRDLKLQEQRAQLKEQVDLRTNELAISEQQKRQLLEQQNIQKAYSRLVAMLNAIDISLILEKSLNHICSQLDASWGVFYLWNTDTGRLSMKKSFNSRKAGNIYQISKDVDTYFKKTFDAQQVQVYPLSWQYEDETEIAGIVTALPLRFQDKPLGILGIASQQELSDWSGAFLQNASQQLGVAIHNALTFQELRAKSAALKQSNVDLERASQMKSEFLANMSHELRTPLNAIIGFSEILVDQHFGQLNDLQEEYLSDILTSGRHLLALINDILDLSKVEAGKMELAKSRVDMEALIKNSLTMVREKALKHHIALSLDFDEGTPPSIEADERRIKQVLFNLLSNAVKFTAEGGKIDIKTRQVTRSWLRENLPPEFKADLRPVLAQPEGHYLLVAITDTGIGIKPSSVKKIFDSFQQEESSTSKKYGGTGLGLTLCKNLIELHRGGIWVNSRFGHGSTFSFVLPLRIADASSPTVISGPVLKREKPLIMVVDDDEMIRRSIAANLSAEHYDIEEIGDGPAAIERAREIQPDLILLDVMLPGMDGWDVLSMLKRDATTHRIPVVICSAIEDRRTAYALQASDYLVKPIQKQDLLHCLENVGIRPQPEREKIDVLLVEPDLADQLHFSALLENSGYSVQCCDSVAQAQQQLMAESIQLVMTDMLLPEMNGYEFIEIIKTDPKLRHLPVIVMVDAAIHPHTKSKILERIDAIIQKNDADAEQLLTHIGSILNLRKTDASA